MDHTFSRLVTIIKRLVHHAVYCMSLSCLLSFLMQSLCPLSNLLNFSFTCIIMLGKKVLMRACIRGSEMPYFSHLVTMQEEEEEEEEEDSKSVKVEIKSITPVLQYFLDVRYYELSSCDIHKSQIEWNLKVKCQISL